MRYARAIELLCGIILTLLEIYLIVYVFQDAYRVSKHLNEPPDLFSAIVLSIFYYSLPCLLVISGSYFHAIQRKHSGMLILITGSVLTILVFLLSLRVLALSGGFAQIWGKFYLLTFAIAIFIIPVSIVVERQNKKAISS